jgi:predicted Rossmann-fold nucleotide-binding protein
VCKDYWSGLIDWIKNTMLEHGMISEKDLDIFHLVDSVEDAVAVIENFYEKYELKPNF